MPVEAATHISEIDPTTVGDTTDPIEAGSQINLVKDVLKRDFASIAGIVTASHTDLNRCDVTTEGTAEASKVLTASATSTFNAAGMTWTDLGTVTTVTINGGTISGATITASTFNGTGGSINGTTIGATTPSTGAFTTLTASGAVTFTSGTINGVVIGGTTPAAGTFTALTATSATLGALNGTTIGAATPSTGVFTSLTLTNAVTEFSTDTTLAGASNSAVPTEAAVKAYVDAASCYVINAVISDISTAGTVYIPISRAGTVTRVDSVLGGTIATADAAISLTTSADQGMANLTVAFSGSGAGDVDTDTTINNSAVTAGTYLKLSTDGASTNAVPLYVSILVSIP